MLTTAYSIDCYGHFCIVFDVSKTFRVLGQDIYILIACTPRIKSTFNFSDNIENCELDDEKMKLGIKSCCHGKKLDIQFPLDASIHARNYRPQLNFNPCNMQSWEAEPFISFASKLRVFLIQHILTVLTYKFPITAFVL